MTPRPVGGAPPDARAVPPGRAGTPFGTGVQITGR